MIAFLKGEIIDIRETSAVVLAGGVGYEVNMPSATLNTLENGREASFYITESLSPYDGTSLYGFLSKEEQNLFLLFKESIPNTGPKKALEFLTKALRSLPDFHNAIVTQDVKILTGIFGFTAKTAQKIIDALKGKMDSFTVQGESKIKTIETPYMSELLAALSALGYSAAEARRAIEKLHNEGALSADMETNIKSALRVLRK